MALCLASSLVVRQGFIPYDQLVRYKWWYRNGYMSSTGKCFDIGAATRNSLIEFERRQAEFIRKHPVSPPNDIDHLSDPHLLKKFKVDCGAPDAAGNGALMRLAPVPLFFYRHPESAVEFSGTSGEITHGDQRSTDACRYYGALIVAALNGESKEELLSKHFYDNHVNWFNNKRLDQKIMEIAEGSFKKYDGHKGGIRGKGYVVESLKAALWAFWFDQDSFETGALAAVNLGDDADTTAAIYGQLAGAYYGYSKLSEKWRKKLYAEDFILCLSEWIVYEGERWRRDEPLAATTVASAAQSNVKTGAKHSKAQSQNSHGSSPSSQATSEKKLYIPSERRLGSASKFPISAHPPSDTYTYGNTTLPMTIFPPDTSSRASTLKENSSTNANAGLERLARQNIVPGYPIQNVNDEFRCK